MITKSFGECLREYRESRNMSQQDLADILGTTKQVLSRYETGQRDPKISTAVEYAEKLNISLTDFLGSELPLSQQVSSFSPDRLSAFRRSRGFTVSEAAKLCDLTLSEYQAFENGCSVPSTEQLQQLAIGFCTSVDALLGLDWTTASHEKTLTAFEREVLNIEDSSSQSFVPEYFTPSELSLLSTFRKLNQEGQEKILSYASDLESSGKYIKSNPTDLGQKQA